MADARGDVEGRIRIRTNRELVIPPLGRSAVQTKKECAQSTKKESAGRRIVSVQPPGFTDARRVGWPLSCAAFSATTCGVTYRRTVRRLPKIREGCAAQTLGHSAQATGLGLSK